MDDPRDEYPEPGPLDEDELASVQQDLSDLAEFRAAFEPEGLDGVAVWCDDCREDHYYSWDLLEDNLKSLIETGETPVHEPPYAPDPARYIGWDYARGYVDALRDAGAGERLVVDRCPRCGLLLDDAMQLGNFCRRCGTPLIAARLHEALGSRLGEEEAAAVLREIGLPRLG